MLMPNASEQQISVFANAKSRRGGESFQRALDLLKAAGVAVGESQLYRDPGALDKRVGEAVKKGARLVVVGGGDGTLSMVAKHFVKSESTLGVLPLGTGNAFARDLSIMSLEKACETIAKGSDQRIDLGHAVNDYFVNVITAGLTARIASELNDDAKKRFGRAVYLFAMARGLSLVKAFHAKLTMVEETLEFDTLQIVIGNGRYHAGPFPLSPDASITEGKLSGYAMATTNRASFLKLAWKLRTGRQCDLPEVYSIWTEGGKLETWPARKVVVDGEISNRTPIEFKVVPKAISVRVPEEFKG